MELEHLEFTLRPRNHWEAMDLGVLFLRRWWRQLYAGWLVVALPVMLLAGGLLWDSPGLAALLVWWLKPLFERIPLHMLSRGIFSELPGVRQSVADWRRLLFAQMLPRLTYRRLSLTRSFDTSVDLLEGLHGEPRQQRLKVLHRSAGSQAFWLTLICVHVEAFISIGILMLIFMLIPEQVEVDWWELLVSSQTGAFDWFSNLLYFLSILLVGPVYVTCGFLLYINRRIELEGWDIELGFRNLARRVRSGRIANRS